MPSQQIYFTTHDNIKLMVLIKPQAKNNQIIGIMNGKLKIAIAATPINGKANRELINFMASFLKIKKSDITILYGLNNISKILSLPLIVQNTLDEVIKQITL